ncbi:hypothetical protein BRD00_13555 [Halobacteriales archaeon QS_8_69_26]|nr:MAG: hypothetical protein BRD00_13555 [Halobacteriales archaeon QS_8_69_26]
MSADDGPGQREVAHRVFAAEYEDATVTHREGEEERAPTYVVTPSGAKANRLFFVGVLTEVEDVNEEMVRARVVDPTGAFVVYAGQYQPDERAFFERAEPPEFVAVTGKARTFEPEGADRVFSSVRPESVNAVDAETRDRWVVDAARDTLGRVAALASAIRDGADEGPAGLDPTGGVALALEGYGTTPAYLSALRDLGLDALRVVAGEREEVRPLQADPDDGGPADVEALADLSVDAAVDAPAVGTATGSAESTATGSAEATEPPGETTTEAEPEAETAVETEPDAEAEPTDGAATEAGSTPGAETEPEADTEPEPAEADEEPPETTAAAGAGATSESEAGSDAEPEPTTDTGPETEVGSATGTGPEPEVGSATGTGPETEVGSDDIGDFEPGDLTAADDGEADPADVETDEMYELDEEERREVEEEYGTEFTTGTEVESPDDPESTEPADPEASTEPEPSADEGSVGEEPTDETEPEPETGEPAEDAGPEAEEASDEPEPEPEAEEPTDEVEAEAEEPADEVEAEESADEAASEPAGDVDLGDVLMDHMRDLDDGGGADREELVASVADATGASADEVEDAIQDALMGGQCYEPDDETLKPI